MSRLQLYSKRSGLLLTIRMQVIKMERFYVTVDDTENFWIGDRNDKMAFPIRFNGFIDPDHIKKIADEMNKLAKQQDDVISYNELDKILEDVFEMYLEIFKLDKMDFNEFAILENILIKMQNKLKEVRYGKQ